MTTSVEFHFVLPTGEPVANAPVEVQLARASFNDDDSGVAMPRPITVNTDEDGKAVLELWPSDTLYFVTVLDTASEAGISYKFLVPEVAPGTTVRLQDLVVDLPPAGTTYDVATLLAIQSAKAEVLSARDAVEAVAASIEDISEDVAAALSAKDAAELAAFNAQTAATAAAASLASMDTQASDAAASASAAAASAGAAGTSAGQAATSAAAASTSQTSASTSAGTATTKAAEAAASAAAALTSQNAAGTSASNAATSATAAAGSATTANTKAGEASTSATAAAASATAAGVSEDNAETAATAAAAALDAFTDLYLGAKASAPTLDNDGNALVVGALYFDTTVDTMFTYTGEAWQSLATDGTGGGDVTSVAGRTGAVVLTKTDVGLANVDNTSDANKPVSTATQTALDAKQATLVSGTSIKTLNGTSLLGSGNIDLAAGGVTAFNTRTGAVTLTDSDITTALGSTAVTNATNAASAAALATPRNINGVAFDGTGNITINAVDATARIAATEKGVANGVATLDSGGLVPASQLPSYVDDVLEHANLAAFPGTGETGKIYVALDTNKTYRWSGSAYVYITSGAVDSVAGKTGVVTLVKGDVGLGNVDNTADSAKSVASAATLTTSRNINGVAFNGSANITVADATKLPLAGGALTGNVSQSATPTDAAHLVHKGYVDTAVAAAGSPLTVVTVTDDTYTAEAGELVVMSDEDQSVCYAPEDPVAGDTFAVMFTNGRVDNILGYSGEALMGAAGNITLDVTNLVYTFRYINSTIHWRLV